MPYASNIQNEECIKEFCADVMDSAICQKFAQTMKVHWSTKVCQVISNTWIVNHFSFFNFFFVIARKFIQKNSPNQNFNLKKKIDNKPIELLSKVDNEKSKSKRRIVKRTKSTSKAKCNVCRCVDVCVSQSNSLSKMRKKAVRRKTNISTCNIVCINKMFDVHTQTSKTQTAVVRTTQTKNYKH